MDPYKGAMWIIDNCSRIRDTFFKTMVFVYCCLDIPCMQQTTRLNNTQMCHILWSLCVIVGICRKITWQHKQTPICAASDLTVDRTTGKLFVCFFQIINVIFFKLHIEFVFGLKNTWGFTVQVLVPHDVGNKKENQERGRYIKTVFHCSLKLCTHIVHKAQHMVHSWLCLLAPSTG